MSTKKLTFEQAFARLEEIATCLEEGAATLEETIKLFEEANELQKLCSDFLDKAESKLQILLKNKDEYQLEIEDE